MVYKGKKDKPNYQRRLADFRDKGNILFDLSKCKCSDMVSNCKCSKEWKVPAKERQFLQDQRGPRKMIIGGIDQEETSKLKRKSEREEANLKRMKKHKAGEKKVKPILPKTTRTRRTLTVTVPLSMRLSTFQNQLKLSQSRIANVKK